ncbi:MAG: hypothetical protein ABIH18_05935 [Candidatus Omnitrophota bacterium]
MLSNNQEKIYDEAKISTLGLLRNTIFVSLRGAKRRSNLVLSSENKIAALPSVARNDTFGEFRNSPTFSNFVKDIN